MCPISSTLQKMVEWLRKVFSGHHQRASGNEERDIISDLPDDILSQIISWLPIKDAAQTSLLSKRWINIWRFITNLNIDGASFTNSDLRRKRDEFKNILSEIRSPVIHSFTLSDVSGNLPKDLLNSWISSILDRDVEKFHVNLARVANFPSKLFECSTLTEINLGSKKCCLNIHDTPLHLPNLQILLFTGLVFQNCSSSSEILIDFPLVKVFKLKECMFINVQNLRINIPMVKTFVFEQPRPENRNLICFTIELCAPSLIKLTLNLATSPFIIFIPPNPSSIQNASLECKFSYHLMGYHHLYKPKLMNSLANGFLRTLKSVKCLKLGVCAVWILRCCDNLAANLPIFDKLVHLEIDSTELKLEILLSILHKTPVLESLICRTCVIDNRNYLTSEVAPQCVAYHLKKLTLLAVYDTEAEFNHAVYFLKNARILEQMKITIVPRWTNTEQVMEKFKERVSRCAKVSSHVEITYNVHS